MSAATPWTGWLLCDECGEPFWLDDNEVSYHHSDDAPDGIDHDADEDHVAFSLPEDEDE